MFNIFVECLYGIAILFLFVSVYGILILSGKKKTQQEMQDIIGGSFVLIVIALFFGMFATILQGCAG